MGDVERFSLPDTRADGAGIDLVKVHCLGHRGGDYNLDLIGNGFEASRYLTHEEAVALRDWLIIAIMNEAQSPKQGANHAS